MSHEEILRLPFLHAVFEAIDQEKSGSVDYSELAEFGRVRTASRAQKKKILALISPCLISSLGSTHFLVVYTLRNRNIKHSHICYMPAER